MACTDTDLDSISFPGSMKAGLYTAQLGVSMTVSRESIALSSPLRSFCLDRQHFVGLKYTSILGVFKRGIRFLHRQPGLSGSIVFYPSVSREDVRKGLREFGWS